MAKKVEEIFINNLFRCNNFACQCEKETEYIVPGEPPKITLKINSQLEKPLHFSYAPEKGLNLSGIAGGVIVENILGKLLALQTDDLEAVIQFIKTYGFLFPITSDAYESVDAVALSEIINRIKATIHLINALAGQKNYKQILIMTTYLLYAEPITLNLSTVDYTTCKHPFNEMLHSYNIFPDLSRNQEVFNTHKYSVPDTLFPPIYKLDIDFFNHVRSGDDSSLLGSNSPWFKNLLALYSGYFNGNEELRLIIDFYFHYQCDVGVFKEISYERIRYFSTPHRDNFTDEMKVSLLKIANIVIARELNVNLIGIYPQLESGSLTPSWKIESFLQALYFSIFYMKPGVELYKRCKNPNCKRDVYFPIKATTTNKEYCCRACGGAAATRRSRQKKLENK